MFICCVYTIFNGSNFLATKFLVQPFCLTVGTVSDIFFENLVDQCFTANPCCLTALLRFLAIVQLNHVEANAYPSFLTAFLTHTLSIRGGLVAKNNPLPIILDISLRKSRLSVFSEKSHSS